MYNFKKIEKKWQEYWKENKTFEVKNSGDNPYYILVEFPYPSGSGLHVGHVRSYTAQDVRARMMRMQGYNVLYPMGYDAFGAPAEEYAIKTHQHPKNVVRDNIKVFGNQMRSLGFSFDWSREFSTTDPEYYRWTQWQFIQFFKHGMAYKDTTKVNWCPKCKMVLSNEDAAGGVCERCGSGVEQREKSQWLLKMASYSEDLLKGLDDTNFAPRVKLGQINWIGKSTGVEMDVNIVGGGKFSIFTTCIETVYGITFFVIAPDGKLIKELMPRVKNKDEVEAYIKETSLKSNMDRTELNKGKSGVLVEGVKAINPINGKEVPIFLGDFVLGDYGTGAVMAVPAHDQRDYEYAKVHNLPIVQVIEGDVSTCALEKNDYLGKGIKLMNSEEFTGKTIEEAKEAITVKLEKMGIARRVNNYKMRDWVFGRQRFWGEPIPMIYCDECGWQPVNEEDLPVLLPDVTEYEPTDIGESPLAKIESFVNCKCPKCGKDAKRETDTMPQWAGSSWYFLRFMDPSNNKEFASMDSMKYWNKIDWYNGGMEHTARHLLYARFWVQFLYNIGLVPNKEMIWTRVSHGMILGADGEKMSKSKGNVINPDDMVHEYGADALRVYEMFIGDYTKDASWSENGLKGCFKFLNRIWNLQDKLNDNKGYSSNLENSIHKTIKKVTNDINDMSYNTAVSSLMILLNEMDKLDSISRDDYRVILQLLNPFAPHITEELNELCNLGSIFTDSVWPSYDEAKTQDDEIEIGVQVNGKLRSTIKINKDEDKDIVEKMALDDDKVKKNIEGKEIVKVIVVPNRIVNIVIKG